jgi:uncharacterized membrane protein YjjP (DUF1212 family)
MEYQNNQNIKEIGNVLLEVSSLLMSCGATTNRIRITTDRIAESFGFNADMLITNRALTLSLSTENNEQSYSSLKRTSPHGVNYRIVSGISRMSWRVVREQWSIGQIKQELERLTSLPSYPRLLVLALVSLSGAAFCRIFGGDFFEMIVTFLATFAGMFIRQESAKMEFNPYMCVFFASLTASLISGAFRKIGFGNGMEHAFTASVLFLVPGVPLINSFSDLIDGNILNGIVRGINGILISFAIALGLLIAIIIYG